MVYSEAFQKHRSKLRNHVGLALVPLLYFASAKFTIEHTTIPDAPVLFWPCTSVLLAAFLLLDKPYIIPAILLGLAAEIAGGTSDFTRLESLVLGLTNTLDSGAAALLLRRWRFNPRFASPSDVTKFVVAAPLVGSCIGALSGAYVYNLIKPAADVGYLEQVRHFWYADAPAFMIFAPLLFGLWPLSDRHDAKIPARAYDAAPALATLVVLGLYASARDGYFMGVRIGPTLLLPFVLYFSVRFGTRIAAALSAVLATTTILIMVRGHQPFGPVSARETVIQAQEFFLIMSLMAMGSAALLGQLRGKQEELEAANLSLHDLNTNLETRVEERTQELSHANQQLEKEIRERQEAEHALQLANQELLRLAEVDGLTHIANRRAFDARLQSEWKRLARDGGELSLILLDIDFFKRYNDHYGHQAGDACLIQVSAAIAEAVKRPADLAARYGGEEFVVILPETDEAGAQVVAEEIQSAVRALGIEHETSDSSAFVTTSAGIATCIPSQNSTPSCLLISADQGLYRAKAQGRNCCVNAAVAV